ncbi:MAG TPA: TlpA disulfide reductase family protein, partial [Gaiellaceae bacterium]|nr:TlpA disulfide reductase family protein [Gaiellaceae bacterium]
IRVLASVVVAALLGLLVWDMAHSSGGKIAREVDKGQIVKAPAFSLPRVTGQGKLTLASLRGKVVVLNFWASDCVPCKQEQAELNKAADRWAGKGVVFLGMDEIEVRSFAQKYMQRYHVAYPSVADGDGSIAGRFGVTGTPETFFIDRKGRVVPPHIISIAKPSALDAGIRRALST